MRTPVYCERLRASLNTRIKWVKGTPGLRCVVIDARPTDINIFLGPYTMSQTNAVGFLSLKTVNPNYVSMISTLESQAVILLDWSGLLLEFHKH